MQVISQDEGQGNLKYKKTSNNRNKGKRNIIY